MRLITETAHTEFGVRRLFLYLQIELSTLDASMLFEDYMVNGAVRLNGEAKRSSRPTSLKTLPAFTHGRNWDCTDSL